MPNSNKIPEDLQVLEVANNIPALCWLADDTGYIYWYNTRWFDYTGTDTKAMEGWGWQSVHHPKTIDLVVSRWTNSLATGKQFAMIFPLRGADGVYRPFLTKASPISENGKITSWFGINVEVSDMLVGDTLKEWTALTAIMGG